MPRRRRLRPPVRPAVDPRQLGLFDAPRVGAVWATQASSSAPVPARGASMPADARADRAERRARSRRDGTVTPTGTVTNYRPGGITATLYVLGPRPAVVHAYRGARTTCGVRLGVPGLVWSERGLGWDAAAHRAVTCARCLRSLGPPPA
jgi:hypothetical protein